MSFIVKMEKQRLKLRVKKVRIKVIQSCIPPSRHEVIFLRKPARLHIKTRSTKIQKKVLRDYKPGIIDKNLTVLKIVWVENKRIKSSFKEYGGYVTQRIVIYV